MRGDGDEIRGGARLADTDQGDPVTARDERVGQLRHHLLHAAVAGRRHLEVGRGDEHDVQSAARAQQTDDVAAVVRERTRART
ncbi:Uncharacterised protein [Mycobacteroides abscessus subsp. abscessus]|nr:Uncharacterised protein [Mycobacteroides abscessus subsp. abscessus]